MPPFTHAQINSRQRHDATNHHRPLIIVSLFLTCPAWLAPLHVFQCRMFAAVSTDAKYYPLFSADALPLLLFLHRRVCFDSHVDSHQLRLSRLAAATSTTTDAIATSTTNPIAFMFRILLIPRRYRRFVIQFRPAPRRTLPRCFD